MTCYGPRYARNRNQRPAGRVGGRIPWIFAVNGRDSGALLRRARLAAVLAIAGAALVVGYRIHAAGARYSENALVIFSLPRRVTSVNAYSWLSPSLIFTGEMITQQLMTAGIRREIGAAGGVADYQVALVNLYNQDYPDYSYPEATVAVSAASPAATGRTFRLITGKLTGLLAVSQRRAGTPRAGRITAEILGSGGPRPTRGSAKRSLAGLVILAAVLAASAWTFLGRIGRRPGRAAAAASPVRRT